MDAVVLDRVVAELPQDIDNRVRDARTGQFIAATYRRDEAARRGAGSVSPVGI